MRSIALVICSFVIAVVSFPNVCFSAQVNGEVTLVNEDRIYAEFTVPVRQHAMMIVLSGRGEAVAGVAISERCVGVGPYQVVGRVSYIADAASFKAGKTVYVNSANVLAAPPKLQETKSETEENNTQVPGLCQFKFPADQDLKLYYYAAGQTVGYGAVGLGYNRTVRLSRSVGLEIDGGITTTGNVNSLQNMDITSDQLIKNASARLKFRYNHGLSFYAGFRYSEGKGNDDGWYTLVNNLVGKDFQSASEKPEGTVTLVGMEYGIGLRPFNKLSIYAGYIPEFRTDYGSIGVRSEPAYTAELRLGGGRGTFRLRGVKSEDYWIADLGITIR